MNERRIYIGFDPRELAAYYVAVNSIRTRLSKRIPIHGLVLSTLVERGLHQRPTFRKDGLLYDTISGHPMSTEFAISRFLVPYLAKTGWALFLDCDVLARDDLVKLFDLADPRYAVMCIQHEHKPSHRTKMDGQVQTAYPRKNWSSVCLFNCDHPANKQLTLRYVNTVPGRVLHAFSWLTNDEIGALPPEYNYLVGTPELENPKIVHFTEGTPHMRGYEESAYADEWRAELNQLIPGVLGAFRTIPE